MKRADAGKLVGQVLGDVFRLDALVGQGGFGAVFRATDLRLDRTVAVKLALRGHDPHMARRFRREAKAQAGLRHPGIVRMLEYGLHDGQPYIVQEFVEGRTLRAVVETEGPLVPARARAIFGGLLDALDEAHAQGIVHRDIKPENIMIVDGRRGEEVRLLDFGIAKLLDRRTDLSESLTPDDAIVGSVSWLAPEQAGGDAITPQTDLYSVGCVMFWALTGHKPFHGPARDVLLAHMGRPPPAVPPYIPPGLAGCIERAMLKVATKRHGSAEAMAAAVRRVDPADGPDRWTPREVHGGDEQSGGIRATGGLEDAGGAGETGTGPDTGTGTGTDTGNGTGTGTGTGTGEATETDESDERAPVDPWPRIAAILALLSLAVAAWGLLPPDPTPTAEDSGRSDAAVDARLADSRLADARLADTRFADARAVDAQAVDDAAADAAAERIDATPDAAPRRPSTARFDRALAACECDRAARESRRLIAGGVDRRAALRKACGPPTAASSCAAALTARVEAAMARCPCHGADVAAMVEQLAREYGVDLRARWRNRCKLPGMPNGCISPAAP